MAELRRSPRISVGISTVNRPAALARCLDALLSGERLPDEILVVDQGGDEQTRQAVEERRSIGPSLVYIHQTQRGLSAARNEMIRRARYDLIAVTDDDCVPDKEWIAAISVAFDTHPHPDAVTGRVLPLGPDEPGLYAVSLRTRTVPLDFTSETLPWRVGTGANFAARTALLRELGGYDERLGAGSPGQAAEDLELCHRLLRARRRIRYTPDAVVYHERQTLRRRLDTRWSYAFGIGATCAMIWRRGDRHALRFIGTWLRRVMTRLLKSAARLNKGAVQQALLSLGGTIHGYWYGMHLEPSERGVIQQSYSRSPQ